MRFNALAVVWACGVVCASVYAYPPNYSDEPPAVNDSADNDDGGGGGYAIPQFNLGYAQLFQQHQEHNKPSGTYITTSKTTLTSESVAEPISATTTTGRPSLQPAFVYSAQVPAHIEPEANKVVNAVKLASSTAAAAYPSSSSYHTGGFTNTYQSTFLNDNVQQDGDLSKKPIGSSVASAVSVILNGDQPEFTDALGQKVPKPQPSLQVASPIDLLNPDRYEFYTFDEHGELVKRLMTMEEIQSIVANGDGDGPTIIHHGPVEDRDPEKNVQDIVNSVQDVLNKEVESSKNTTSNILPVLDTPDVSSSWSMILPAIFGNTGGIDIFPQQKPQQIVMTPDTELIETSTKATVSTTTAKPKTNKRKPGHKRKPSTTTTEMTPQVIQEELDSHESVYTGMQQYQHLTANMHNYDSFSQMHMQPIYHKLPEPLSVETTTKRVFINNQEVVQKPSVDDLNLNLDLAKKPPSVHHKPMPPHRIKKPNGGQTTTKRPHNNKQKTKRKPTTTTTIAPETTTIEIVTTPQPTTTTPQPTTTTPQPTTTTPQPTTTTPQPTTTTPQPTTTTVQPTTTTALPTTTTTQPTTTTPQPTTTTQATTTTTTTTTQATTTTTTTEPEPTITTSTQVTDIPSSTTTTAPKKKKKKPTRQPIHTFTTAADGSSVKPQPTAEKRKPSPKPHRHRPAQHTTTSPDLAAEGSAHQEVSHNKYQHVSYHRPRPKPQKSTTTPKTTTTPVPLTTVIFSPVPESATVATPQEPSLIVEEFPGFQPIKLSTTTRVTTETPKLPTTTANIPSSSGTAGYPIPAYGLATDDSEESNSNQYKKQPLPSLAMIQQVGSKPYDQDIHTLQSFDQIMQSLKQPELSEKVDQLDDIPSTQVKPVKYDSAENMDQLEEMAIKHMIPVTNSMIDSPTTTIPLYTQNIASTTLIEIETTTYPSSSNSEETTASTDNTTPVVVIPTRPQFPLTTNEPEDVTTSVPIVVEIKETETTNAAPVENMTEPFVGITDTTEQFVEEHTEHTETTITRETTGAPHVQQDSLYVQEPHTVLHELTTETPINLPPINYGETTTDSVEMSEETTVQGQYRLPVAAPQKEHIAFMDDDKETDTQTILVADLKPQLNMEVLKPSSQISMSDFQTQAATVASTLVDGTNTIAADYNMMSSNETKDEIAFLMSDVIKQMSNNGHSATKPEEATYTSSHHFSNNHHAVSTPMQENYNDNQHSDGGHGFYSSDQMNVNDNRYSNVAKLNTSFLVPVHGEVFLQTDLLDSYGNAEIKLDQQMEQKPSYERLEDSFAMDIATASPSEEYPATMQPETTTTLSDEMPATVGPTISDEMPPSMATTINDEITTSMTPLDYTTPLPPDSMEDDDSMKSSEEFSSLEDTTTTTTSYAQETTPSEDTTTNSLQSFETNSEESDGDDNTSTMESEEEDSTTPIIVAPIEASEESTTFEVPVPSLSQIYAEQQTLEDANDREALFEADSSVDTTTEINNLSEETTETRWQASSEESKMPTFLEQKSNTTTHIIMNDENVAEISDDESKDQQTEETLSTDRDSSEEDDATATTSMQSTEEDKMDISEMESATIKVESTEGQDVVSNNEDVTEAITASTISGEDSVMDNEDRTQFVTVEDSETNDTNLEHSTETAVESTTLKADDDSEEYSSIESEEDGNPDIATQLPLYVEDSTDKADIQQLLSKNEDVQTTTQNYEMSEETSEELNAMISEEDETDEFVDEDPYIKLGETTTPKSVESSTVNTVQNSSVQLESGESEIQTVSQTDKITTLVENSTLELESVETEKPSINQTEKETKVEESILDNSKPGTDDGGYMLESVEAEKPSINQTEKETKVEESILDNSKPGTDEGGYMLAPPKPINDVVENDIPTGTHSILETDNEEPTFEGADEEDEDDQLGYQTPKLPTSLPSSSTTTVSSTTTTPKPTASTTRRLNTLKPVSYFNKQPAYALYQDPVEPLYNKQPSYPAPQQQQENVPNKFMTYSIPTPQQRPMQRPPQLSNLMIGSTQATRPPVKLEPSPNSSKGLEASLVSLDEDILAFATLCNELAFSYWKSITSEKISSARSLVISPFALTSMLSMVFLGARGSTSGEMNDILKLDDMVTFNPHLVFKNITDSVEKAMDSDIATTAFVREVFSDRANGKILQFFKEKTQQLYAGHVEEVNFHVVNDIIRRRTNLLVKRHTMGKVLEYLRTNSVWVNGPLATISANLFQTDCSHGSTQDRDGELFFQVHPTVRQRRLVPIPAVLFKSGFTAGYEPTLEATVVAFGRIQDTVSMIYVMPGHQSSVSPSDNLDRLEKELMETAISKNSWSNLLTSLMDRPGMEVQLPRFSHRSFVNATLGLQKMGLKGLFKSDYADLGGLTGSSNRDIYLSDMIQINTFSTCGEEKIADHHHVEMYPAPPLRKRNKDVDAHDDDDFDSSEAVIDFGSLVHDSALGRGFYDDLLDPKYLELPLPLRPRQARVPDAPRLRFDKPFLYFVRHNPTGMILFMGRFNPRLLP